MSVNIQRIYNCKRSKEYGIVAVYNKHRKFKKNNTIHLVTKNIERKNSNMNLVIILFA